jgi:hypothetical protein
MTRLNRGRTEGAKIRLSVDQERCSIRAFHLPAIASDFKERRWRGRDVAGRASRFGLRFQLLLQFSGSIHIAVSAELQMECPSFLM